MAELAMLADIQRTIHPEEVTRQLHGMAPRQLQVVVLCLIRLKLTLACSS